MASPWLALRLRETQAVVLCKALPGGTLWKAGGQGAARGHSGRPTLPPASLEPDEPGLLLCDLGRSASQSPSSVQAEGGIAGALGEGSGRQRWGTPARLDCSAVWESGPAVLPLCLTALGTRPRDPFRSWGMFTRGWTPPADGRKRGRGGRGGRRHLPGSAGRGAWPGPEGRRLGGTRQGVAGTLEGWVVCPQSEGTGVARPKAVVRPALPQLVIF